LTGEATEIQFTLGGELHSTICYSGVMPLPKGAIVLNPPKHLYIEDGLADNTSVSLDISTETVVGEPTSTTPVADTKPKKKGS
ncbi:hypothetical protein ABK046_46420, partial [Streptomyces caeruleatus]